MRGPAPLLVLGVGNPSRGDDALGPLFLEALALRLGPELGRGEVELLTDFQLQIEHALDLRGRARVVFADASVGAAPPFTFTPTVAARDRSATTHALSPAAVLAAYAEVEDGPPPVAYTLAMRGESFALGEPPTATAARSLEAAVAFVVDWVRGAPDAAP